MSRLFECKQRKWYKLRDFAASLMLLGLAVLVTFIDFTTGQIFDLLFKCIALYCWIPALYAPFLLAFAAPDCVIFDEGLEIKILQKRKFFNWDEINLVKRNRWQTVVFVNRITPFNYLIGILSGKPKSPAFIIRPGFENYEEAIRFLENKLANRFIST